MDKRFFFAALSGASLAELYRARVLADGGTVYNYAAVQAAYARAAAWGLDTTRTHWSSPQFGSRVSGGQLDTRYCLFGHDAVPSGAVGWQVQPAPGKAPQHYTNKVSFQFMGLPWRDLDLTAHVICQPRSYQSDAYPYFPIIESSEEPGRFSAFLLSAETGIMEGGHQDPGGVTLAQDAGYVPVGALATLALQIATAQPTQPRLFINNRQATGAYTSTPPTSTAYAPEPVYLGARGAGFFFDGNINDVLITSQVLTAAALQLLNSQVTAY